MPFEPVPHYPDALPAVNISGFQGSGKTFLAQLLAMELQGRGLANVRVRPLAEPLKRMAEALTGDANFAKAKDYPLGHGGTSLSGRQVLQRLGTDAIRREFRPDVWLWLARKSADPDELSVVDDCRFPNEKLPRDFCIYLKASGQEAPDDAHASEAHQAALRDRADLRVLRVAGTVYEPGLGEVADRIAEWARGTGAFWRRVA